VADANEVKPPISPLGMLIVLAVVVAFTGINSIFYTIKPEEVGVILRFGKVARVSEPGLGFKFPFDIEKIYKVKVKRIAKEEFGFRTIAPGIRTQYQKKGYGEESLLLTGDLNVVDLEWIIQYRVQTPVDFLFNVRSVGVSIRDISEAVMRRVVGDRSFNEILSERNEVAEAVLLEMQNILNKYECGIKVLTVKLQDVNPPKEVKGAFNEVNEAIQEKERYINEAQEIYNNKIPKAKGEARRAIAQSEGYAVTRVNKAKGDISRFNAVYSEYKTAKDITRKRLYLEAMERLLGKVKKLYVIDKSQKSLLPLINLSEKQGAAGQGLDLQRFIKSNAESSYSGLK